MPQQHRPTHLATKAEFDRNVRRLAAVLQDISNGEPTVEQRTSENPAQGGTQESMTRTVPLAILNALEAIGYFQDPDRARSFELKPCATGDGGALMRVLGTARGGSQDGGGVKYLPSVDFMLFGRPPVEPEAGTDLGGLS